MIDVVAYRKRTYLRRLDVGCREQRDEGIETWDLERKVIKEVTQTRKIDVGSWHSLSEVGIQRMDSSF